MADGDPMILQTLYGVPRAQLSNFQSLLTNGPMEVWTDTASWPDGWDWAQSGGVSSVTHSRQAGTRTSGLGAYFYRQVYSTEGIEQLGALSQKIILPDNQWDANGIKDTMFNLAVWMRNTGTGTARVNATIQGLDTTGAFVEWNGSNLVTLTGAWQLITYTYTVSSASVAQINANLLMELSVGGAPILEFDEAALWVDYTFTRNPASPAVAAISYPYRKFSRTIGGSLYMAKPASQSAKIRRVLPFVGIGSAQVATLRGLYILDAPMRWTPYEPTLPACVFVRMIDPVFSFQLMRAGWADNLYRGSITLEEI
uniref:Uncharacterized protein n=3 Tax=viral metagenome TaxID=1070528 RepID=A0A6M3K392_9ZZZZ